MQECLGTSRRPQSLLRHITSAQADSVIPSRIVRLAFGKWRCSKPSLGATASCPRVSLRSFLPLVGSSETLCLHSWDFTLDWNLCVLLGKDRWFLAEKHLPRLTTTPTPERSRLLARVRHEGTAPELTLRRRLHRSGLRYRLRYTLPGSPDLVFVSLRIAVFVDGCFWHGCPVHGSIPKTNTDFWRAKIERNRERDKSVSQQLAARGWDVIRVWEHEIAQDLECLVERLLHYVKSSQTESLLVGRAVRCLPEVDDKCRQPFGQN